MAPVLGYWKLRGLGQPIKLLLTYAGVDFESKEYEHDWDEWMAEKYTLGLDFPNLPYYIDEAEGIKMTHTQAIMRYLGKKHGLIAETTSEHIFQDMAEQQVNDFRKSIVQGVYEDWNHPEKKKEFFETKLPQYIKEFSSFLADRKWVAGEKLTFVDFMMYEYMDWALYMEPDCMEKYQNLKDYMTRFEHLPRIKAYRESDSFMHWPLFYKTAQFGYNPEDRKHRFPNE